MSALAVSVGASPSFTQDNQILSRVQVVGGTPGTCPAIFVSFSRALQVISVDFSADQTVVSIRLSQDTSTRLTDPGADMIETYPGISVPGFGPVAMTLDANAPAPLLTLRFSSAVEAIATQGGESSIVLTGIRPFGATDCGQVPEVGASLSSDTSGGAPVEIEQDYADARAALAQGDNETAIRILTKLANAPENERSADALELLGVARERNGQVAQATAEYETYLARYVGTPGAERVQQRLAVIQTREMAPRPDGAVTDDALPQAFAGLEAPQTNLGDLPPPALVPPRRSFAAGPALLPEPPEPPYRGLLSAYYFRNQGTTVFAEFETNSSDTDSDVFENALVVSADFQGQFDKENTEYRWRFAGDTEVDLANGSGLAMRLSRAYVEVDPNSNGLSYRIGRQSRGDGGILGRFDGVEMLYRLDENTDIKLVAGSPVSSTSDGIYADDRLVFGLSASREDVTPGLDATVYAVQAMREGYIDRRAVGLEAQFQSDNMSLNGNIDYDIYFNTLALARASGTWIMPDKSTLSVTVDQMTSPVMTLGNALTGQTATTLDGLSATYTTDEMKQLALDRTGTTRSATVSYSRGLSDTWQLSMDGSVFYTSGTPASGGVPAQPATGTEVYGSVQLVGNNVLLDQDTLSLSLRVADAATSKLVLFDGYDRFDTDLGFRLKPRIRIGYRDFDAGGHELFALPSLNATYDLNDSVDLEFELGGRISNLTAPTYTEESNELYITLGINKEF